MTVERGGKDLIRVADDGKGMAPEDLPLAFQPHATSKLAEADDLFRIATLGFRGEALAAIAEVSKVRCQTRRADAAEGSRADRSRRASPGRSRRAAARPARSSRSATSSSTRPSAGPS